MGADFGPPLFYCQRARRKLTLPRQRLLAADLFIKSVKFIIKSTHLYCIVWSQGKEYGWKKLGTNNQKAFRPAVLSYAGFPFNTAPLQKQGKEITLFPLFLILWRRSLRHAQSRSAFGCRRFDSRPLSDKNGDDAWVKLRAAALNDYSEGVFD